jgi:hypothetical protein
VIGQYYIYSFTYSSSRTLDTLDDRGMGIRFFLFFAESIPALGPTQPPSEEVPGALFSGVK